MTKKITKPKKVQFIHNTDITTECQIHMYTHCGKCLDEMPEGESPKTWARTQTGWTENGFQVWCTRHDVNVTCVEVRVAP